jgi:hypothetical protein
MPGQFGFMDWAVWTGFVALVCYGAGYFRGREHPNPYEWQRLNPGPTRR